MLFFSISSYLRIKILANSDKGQRLIKNTFIVSLGLIASKGIIFLMAPLFSRWLSVEDYGSFDLITTYVSLLLPLFTLSIAEAVFRFLLDDLNENNKKNIVSSGLFVAVSGYLFFLIVYWLISIVLKKVQFGWQICVLLMAQIIYFFFSEVARGIKRVELYSLFSFSSVVLLSSLSTIFLFVLKWGLSGIVIGYSIAYVIAGIGLFFATKSYKLISISNIEKSSIKKMLKYSWLLIPNSISWWIVNVSDRLIIISFIGLVANGIYAVANKIPAIVSVLFSVFHIAWVQSASETVSDGDYDQYCNAVLNTLIPFIFSSAAILISGNFLFYRFLFDVKYIDAYNYSPILIVAAGIACVGQFIGGIMIAKKDTKQNGVTNIVAALSNIAINLIMVRYFGLYAASISTLLSYFILVLFRYMMIKKHVKLKINMKSFLVLVVTAVIFAGVYMNQTIINIILLLVSFVIFLLFNKELIVRILQILLKKK